MQQNMEHLVEIISRETIKPSSQTPLQCKNLKLSYLDKMLTNSYIPLIFFYEANESRGLITSNHLRISERLKQSLSDTLPSFYPLAGRLKDHLFIDCNDAGVDFVEASVRGQLKDYMYMDDELKLYLPSYCTTFDVHSNRPRHVLVVQVTFFDCGGLVFGACFSHSIADLESAMAFLNAWAASFRGGVGNARRYHSFGTATSFPTLGPITFFSLQRLLGPNQNLKTKRFVFDKAKIDILREIVTSTTSESDIKDPSRVELISAFIWKHFMAARLHKQNAKKIYGAFHAVNLRSRTTPPRLLENVFGNCVMVAMAYTTCHDSADELRLQELVGRLRSSIRRVRGSYITKPMGVIKDICRLGFLVIMGKLEWCTFTSWRGFPTYELDFGWGRPVWFSTPSMAMRNLIILVSSKSGDDVEAIVTMTPDDLQILDAQINLISTNS